MTDEKSSRIGSFEVGFGGARLLAQGDGGAGNAPTFRIVVVSELTARPDFSTGRVPPPDPTTVDSESFDRVFARLAPSLAIDVADPLVADTAPLRIDLVLRDRKDLRPGALAEQVPALRGLVMAKRILDDLRAGRIRPEAARQELARVLTRRPWADAIAASLGDHAIAREESPEEPAAAPSPVAGLDALLDRVDIGPPAHARERDERGSTSFGSIVAAVAGARTRPTTATSAVGPAAARVEAGYRALLASILAHPEVRRLERAWRGLRLLVESAGARTGVEIDVIPADARDVTAVLKRLQSQTSRSSVDLVVVDRAFIATAVDLDNLARWAELGEALLCPVLVDGHASMVGIDTLQALARSTSGFATSDDPRARAVRGLASRASTRWLGVVLNAPLVRAPYTSAAARSRDIDFAQDESDSEACVFGSAALLVAALCARGFVARGWPTSLAGTRDARIGDLPVWHITEQGETCAIALESAPSEAVVREAARAGVMIFSSARNTDAAVLARSPLLHRRGEIGHGTTPSAAFTLEDQLFTGRFARAVQQVAAAIPHGTDPRAARDAAHVMLVELFARAALAAPEIEVNVEGERERLCVTVRPRRFAGVVLEELSFDAALG